MQDRVEEKDYILKKLADFARERVDMAKRKVPSEEIRKRMNCRKEHLHLKKL